MDLALRLARSPQRRLLGEEGLRLLAEIAQRSQDALALQQEVAALAAELGQWELALERAAALSERLPNRKDRARAALEAARSAYELKRAGDAHAFLARVRSLYLGDPLLEIEADASESQVLRWIENRVAEAKAPTVTAAAAARRMVADAGGVDALSHAERRAYLAALRAELDAAIRAADRNVVMRLVEEIEIAAHEPAEVFSATFDALFVLITFVGNIATAEARIRRLLDEARQLVLPAVEAEAMYHLAHAARERGRLEEAEHLAWEVVTLVERAGAPDRFPPGDIRALAHAITVSRGDWRRGVELIAQEVRLEADPHSRLSRRRDLVLWLGRFAPSESAEEIRAQLAGAGRTRMRPTVSAVGGRLSLSARRHMHALAMDTRRALC